MGYCVFRKGVRGGCLSGKMDLGHHGIYAPPLLPHCSSSLKGTHMLFPLIPILLLIAYAAWEIASKNRRIKIRK